MSRGGRTHAVRNQYGHIEYLTDSEIANLRERGEDVEVVGSYRGYPPTAKNSANQARVNELWQKEQEEKQRKARERRKKVGDTLKGATTAAGIASAVHGGIAEPQQQSSTTTTTYGQSSLRSEGERRGAQASDATRDKGRRDRGSGQR